MRVQIGHSRGEYSFIEDLYTPIKNAPFFSTHSFIFPHDEPQCISEQSLKDIDVFIAEISYPSTGLGIELGMAKVFGKRIIGIYKKGCTPSSSIDYITKEKFEYESPSTLLKIIASILNS